MRSCLEIIFCMSFTLCIWPDSEPTKLLDHPKQNLRSLLITANKRKLRKGEALITDRCEFPIILEIANFLALQSRNKNTSKKRWQENYKKATSIAEVRDQCLKSQSMHLFSHCTLYILFNLLILLLFLILFTKPFPKHSTIIFLHLLLHTIASKLTQYTYTMSANQYPHSQ